MRSIKILGVLAFFMFSLVPMNAMAKRVKTGIVDKKKDEEGNKYQVFTDTVYNLKFKTPEHWEFKAQKEGSDGESNPFRLHMVRKDKQIPTQLWESQNLVTPAQIDWFVMDIPLAIEQIRDSLAAPGFEGDWQKPILKQCDLLRNSTFLQKYDITWGKWRGVGFSVERPYQAQISSGSGLYNTVTEKLLADFYVFPYETHKLIIYLVTEREFLVENRELLRSMLEQLTP